MVPLFWTASLTIYLKDKVSGVDQMLWCVWYGDLQNLQCYRNRSGLILLIYYVALYRILEKTHAQIYDIEFFLKGKK